MSLTPIELLQYHLRDFSRQTMFDGEELSVLELSAKVAQKLNDAIVLINAGVASIDGKEDSTNITFNRKLSPTGNFTGTLAGESLPKLFADVDNSLSLVNTLIGMVNSRESIGTIYDGGAFLDTSPPTITVEGGLFE